MASRKAPRHPLSGRVAALRRQTRAMVWPERRTIATRLAQVEKRLMLANTILDGMCQAWENIAKAVHALENPEEYEPRPRRRVRGKGGAR